MGVEARALAMWRRREMAYPRFVRRMTPDALDRVSGAWARMLEAARRIEVER
jgi:hypothetical protein